MAKWVDKIVDGTDKRIACSACGEWGYTRWDIKTPYCPCCGERMENGSKYFDESKNGVEE